MYCRQCSYSLRGSPPGPCPECGRQFDPGHPDSYSAIDPNQVARRSLRILIIVAVGAALVVLFWTLPVPYATIKEVDLNSGEERAVHKVFGIRAASTALPSDFGTLAKAHLKPLGPPVWAPYHYASPFDSLRINYRAGRLVVRLHELARIFDFMELVGAAPPLPDRIRLAEAALGLVAAQQCPIIEFTETIGSDHRSVRVCDEDGNTLAEWNPATPDRTGKPSGP